MKFSEWASKKNQNTIVETLFKIFNSTGFLEEQVLEFWQGFPSDSSPTEIDDPFAAGDEDARPLDRKWQLSPLEKKARRSEREKQRSEREKMERRRAMEIWKKERKKSREFDQTEPPDKLLRDAKDKLLLLRWKGMYERKKKIEELKKILSTSQDPKIIFDLLTELQYLKPPGAKGARPQGDVFGKIDEKRYSKAIQEAISEKGNDYPEHLASFLEKSSLKELRDEAVLAFQKVLTDNINPRAGLIPYGGTNADKAIEKIIRGIGTRSVTSHVANKEDKDKLELKAKPWNWAWLTNSEKVEDPQEIKNIIQRRLTRAQNSIKIDDDYRRKEKTIGRTDSEEIVDPTKLAKSREKSPQMSVLDMDRLEKIQALNQVITNAFKELYEQKGPEFFIVFATTLGLEYDEKGNINIPYDMSPLFKKIKTGDSSKFSRPLILQKLKEKGFAEDITDADLRKILKISQDFIKKYIMDSKSMPLLRTLQKESIGFSDWLFINN